MTQYNKLIRDKIPEIMSAKSVGYKTHTLSESEFKLALLHKLIEEATEALEASNDTHSLTAELADVLEVVDTIITSQNLSKTDIEKVKADKYLSHGGFEKRIFLESTN